MKRLTTGQTIALGQYLAEYNENLSFDRLLDDIKSLKYESYSVAECYEDLCDKTLAMEISGLAQSIDFAIDYVLS